MLKGSQLFGKYSFTRHGRIKKYLENLRENVTLTQNDKEIVEEINEIIDVRIKGLKRITAILVVLYIGVYFSFVSFFFQEFYFLEQVGELIRTIISVFGTTVFVIAIFFVNKVRELHYGDLNLLTAHIISIYNNKFTILDEEVPRLTNKNDYEVFIAFFRKRGFKKE